MGVGDDERCRGRPARSRPRGWRGSRWRTPAPRAGRGRTRERAPRARRAAEACRSPAARRRLRRPSVRAASAAAATTAGCRDEAEVVVAGQVDDRSSSAAARGASEPAAARRLARSAACSASQSPAAVGSRHHRRGLDGRADAGDVVVGGDVRRHRVDQVAERAAATRRRRARPRSPCATSTGWSSWTTPTAPSVRTSATPGRSRQAASPAARPASIRATCGLPVGRLEQVEAGERDRAGERVAHVGRAVHQHARLRVRRRRARPAAVHSMAARVR